MKFISLIKKSLALQIFIALLLAIVTGLLLQPVPEVAENYIRPFGTIFLNLLKFIVVPIVLFSIMSGILSMRDMKKVASIGIRAVVYYFITTAFAVTIGLVVALLSRGIFPPLSTGELHYTPPQESVSFMDTLVNIFPSNFLEPFVSANMLQVIFIAIIIAFSIILIREKGMPVIKGVEYMNNVFMKTMELIIRFSPVGVFALMCPIVAINGPSVLGSLGSVLLVVYICYILHAVVVYSLAVKAIGGLSPWEFFKGMVPAVMFAFSSASSVGTIPLNMECTERLGASKEVTSFVLPLGATINMDGTAIYQGVCTVFIATCYGIELTVAQLLTVILSATLASIGTAGVPGSGTIMLAMVLGSAGLPIDGIALVAGIDRLFDMGRTTVNILGDASCAIIISNREKNRRNKQIS